jgi:hypothetical protein
MDGGGIRRSLVILLRTGRTGGSGNCTTGGVTYYQPIGEVLGASGVTLP